MREYGAGTGALGEHIRAGLERAASPLAATMRYSRSKSPAVPGAEPSADAHRRAIVLGNEFLDALPVHRVINDGGVLRELYVGWREGQFVELMGPISDERLGQRINAEELAPRPADRSQPGHCELATPNPRRSWSAATSCFSTTA